VTFAECTRLLAIRLAVGNPPAGLAAELTVRNLHADEIVTSPDSGVAKADPAFFARVSDSIRVLVERIA